MTKQHLYPTFPVLPTAPLVNGGYYGIINPPPPPAQPQVPHAHPDPLIHNLYEELPCMGVTAEGVRASISDAAPGVYQSALFQGDSTMNRNLLCYRPHAVRRAEAKNLAFSNEITAAEFSDYPDNTGFNFQFLQAISNVLSLTKTFKNTDIVFSTLSEARAQSQDHERSAWTIEDTLALISEYKNHEPLFASSTVRNSKVWLRISAIMKNHNALQCENKSKYLKNQYLKKIDREHGTKEHRRNSY
ncbi:hypothetical protein JTB14_031608 [Gonioctena quinquepunctata]|nr:hypothetical protein JTB14_031608 [Gonioctena quinquepunctata]